VEVQNDDGGIAFADGLAMNNDLEIRHCRVLVAVNDHGSVSAAARELGLAQSTVSETLLSLERLIDAPVMLRRPGKEAALTPAAKLLVPHARALISASAAALASISMEHRGVLRLGTVESVSSFLLPQALTAFRSRWPSVEVQISIGLCDDLHKQVRDGDLDAVLTLEGSQNPRRHDDAWTRTLSHAQLRLIVSPQPPPGATDVKRADLVRRIFSVPDPGGAFPALLRAWFGASNDQPRFESAGSIEGVKSMVHRSDVIGVLPSYAVTAELGTGSLFELKVREPLPAMALGLTTQRQPVEGSPLHDMIQQIEQVFVNPGLTAA
jgi:molybdate transport repressor ModE-like protein